MRARARPDAGRAMSTCAHSAGVGSGIGSAIGIVAIGRNEGERLVRCLRSLQGSGCPVVYVDSGSSDGSVDAARALGASVVALDMARPFTAARARAEGIAALEASHPTIEHVFFVDGDCEVEPGFLGAAREYLAAHPEFAVVAGRRRERFPDASPYNRLIDREWATPVGEAAACGGDALYRREAYRAAGGFDERMLAGEEPELCSRLRAGGWRIMRLDQPMTVHDAAIHRFGQWWKRAIRSGMGYIQAWRATRGSAQEPLYGREIARAVAWAGALPLAAIVLGIAVHPAWLLLWPGALAAQAVRLIPRHGAFATLLLIAGKYAELAGILRYLWDSATGRHRSVVDYKR